MVEVKGGQRGITEELVADAHSLVKLLSADDDAVDEGEEGGSEFARGSFSKFIDERREAVATPALCLQKKTHVVACKSSVHFDLVTLFL